MIAALAGQRPFAHEPLGRGEEAERDRVAARPVLVGGRRHQYPEGQGGVPREARPQAIAQVLRRQSGHGKAVAGDVSLGGSRGTAGQRLLHDAREGPWTDRAEGHRGPGTQSARQGAAHPGQVGAVESAEVREHSVERALDQARVFGGPNLAFSIIAGDTSIPTTSTPRLARKSASSPVPQPSSRTRVPFANSGRTRSWTTWRK